MRLEILDHIPNKQTHPTPLLFVHGMWIGAWAWEEFFLPYFSENGFRALALSLRGHSGSEGHAGVRWYSIVDYVKDVEQVTSQLGMEPVIIGISMGGYIAQKYLETHDAPAGVLLSSGPPTTAWRMVGRFLRRAPLPLLEALFTLKTYPVIKTPRLAQQLLFTDQFSKEALLKYHARMQDESFRAFIDMLGLTRLRPARVRAPMLVLGAEKDWALAPDTRFTARAYGVEGEILPSVGHYMILEPGWKSAADCILSWLKERGI